MDWVDELAAKAKKRGATIGVAAGIIIAQAVIPWGMMGDFASACTLAVFCWWQGAAGN